LDFAGFGAGLEVVGVELSGGLADVETVAEVSGAGAEGAEAACLKVRRLVACFEGFLAGLATVVDVGVVGVEANGAAVWEEDTGVELE